MNKISSDAVFRFGVLGEHLPHTLSPEIHTALFQEQHIPAEYTVYELTADQATQLPQFMETENLTGLNVTIPYKETVFPLMDETETAAQEIGAINTILRKDGKLFGYNTDYIGVLSMFQKAGVPLKGRSIVILGSGGATRALIYGFHQAGAASVTVAARNREALSRLSERFPYLKTCGLENVPSGDILINATPVGMYPNTGKSVVNASVIRRFHTAADIVYNPLITEFLSLASDEGLKTVTGLMMLVDQAIGAQEIWFGKKLDYQIGEPIHQKLAERFLRK